MRPPMMGWAIDIAYMIDQSHNLKGKMEAMVQTVVTAQELYLKAALVDREQLAGCSNSCDLVAAEELFRGAFWSDVRPLTRAWREARGLAGRSAGGAEGERLCGARGKGAGQPHAVAAVSSYAQSQGEWLRSAVFSRSQARTGARTDLKSEADRRWPRRRLSCSGQVVL